MECFGTLLDAKAKYVNILITCFHTDWIVFVYSETLTHSAVRNLLTRKRGKDNDPPHSDSTINYIPCHMSVC